MKLKFKTQQYQTRAVEALADCFTGQPFSSGIHYRIDPGETAPLAQPMQRDMYALPDPDDAGFKNAALELTELELLNNIRTVQRRQNLPLSDGLKKDDKTGCPYNLDVEMETGTGKTYVYLKSMFELKQRYGWSKFIVVVPSIAIREGVYKSLQITADHFLESYGEKARFFIYNSKQLHNLESFSSDAGISVMVINVQAFNSRGADNRRIYDELDDFQSRRPIDVIKANRPILFLDEPQKMEGGKTLGSLSEFSPLFIVRYSATHKTTYNKIHRLDALDAYNQKLVKKISVHGVTTKGLTGTDAYLYLENIETAKNKPPVAWVEYEEKSASGVKRKRRKLGKGDNLHELSGGLDQYKGFVVSDIDARVDQLSFTNGVELTAGEVTVDVTEKA
ncbi:DEAD/DEAH box helicase family protein, partial [Modicisalibacter zincidurans]